MTHLAFQNTLTPHVIVFLHKQGAVYGRGSSIRNSIARSPDVLAANFRRTPGMPTREEIAQAIYDELRQKRYISSKPDGTTRIWTVTRRGLRAVKSSERNALAAARAADRTAKREADATAKVARKRYRRRGLAPSTTE